MYHSESTHHPWINHALHSAMFRFARLHLQPDEEAEDAVQDALFALVEHPEKITHAADVKHYLFGILKNKITDRLRHKYRTTHYDIVEHDDLEHILFREDGRWVKELAPAYWSTPEDQLHSDAFFIVVDVCVNDLPTKIARVFSMKEFLECDVSEICATLNLSQSDYWQCMSRARKRLQICLNTRWFEKEMT